MFETIYVLCVAAFLSLIWFGRKKDWPDPTFMETDLNCEECGKPLYRFLSKNKPVTRWRNEIYSCIRKKNCPVSFREYWLTACGSFKSPAIVRSPTPRDAMILDPEEDDFAIIKK